MVQKAFEQREKLKEGGQISLSLPAICAPIAALDPEIGPKNIETSAEFDEDFAADTLGLGVFDFVKMPVTELEKIEASALTKPESEIMVACKNHDAKLIVTHVERERQAAHLIDHSIVYAQGDFFSPPKFPASNGASERKAK